MYPFRILFVVIFTCQFVGCHRIGAPPSKTPFGEETGVEGPFNKVANAFLLDLRADRLKEAYALTSKEYQKTVNEDQFRAIVEKHPYPSGAGTSRTGSSDIKDQKSIEYHVDENRNNGAITFSTSQI